MRTYRVLLVFGQSALRDRIVSSWGAKTPHPLVTVAVDQSTVWNIWNIADEVTTRTRPFFSSKDSNVVLLFNNKTNKSIKDYLAHIKTLCKGTVIVLSTCILTKADRDFVTSSNINVIDMTDDKLIDFPSFIKHLDQPTL